MQKILNLVSKANKDFGLIEDGDSILVAVSGGKDSLVLLECLHKIKKYFKIRFDMMAITVSLKFNEISDDFSKIATLCENYGISYKVEQSDIADVVFNVRHERSACSLCSKMRKGIINTVAENMGCNKVALGHNLDDVVETFLMNLFSAGKLGCFAPKNYLSRKKIVQIRPLVYVSEQETTALAAKLKLPVVKSRCYVDGKTNREVVKNFLKREDAEFSNIKNMIFGAIRRSNFEGWQLK